MDVHAHLNNIRISPRKVKEVTDLLRGQDVAQAIVYAEHEMKRAGAPIAKLLRSAIANASHNHKIDQKNLIVREILVGPGPTLKRFMPRAYGRATPILKRTSRITVILSEKTEKIAKEETEGKTEKTVAKQKATKKAVKTTTAVKKAAKKAGTKVQKAAAKTITKK